MGLTFAYLSIRVNINHLCRRHATFYFSGMYPLAILTVNTLIGLFPSKMMVPTCFTFFAIMFTTFLVSVINEIKTHLHIRVFHVLPKTD